MARTFDLSVAIFAPAWTKEIVPGDALKNNEIFWTSLSRHLYVHGIRASSKFMIGGDARLSNEKFRSVLYPLTMPSVDLSEEHRLLLMVSDYLACRNSFKFFFFFTVSTGSCELEIFPQSFAAADFRN